MSQTLAMSIFRPKQSVKGCVTVVHGMAEHRTRYDELGRFLSDHGYGVITYDLPGHGDSCAREDLGWFGETGGWDTLVNSAVEMICETRKEFPGVPNYLLGHSMGTIISRCFLQDHDGLVDGVILSGAPNYQSAAGAGIVLGNILAVFKGRKGHSKMMDSMVTGAFNKTIQNPRTDVDWLSFNEENVDSYIADPLDGFGFTVQGYIDELTGVQRMHDLSRFRCTRPDLPIWIFAGDSDPCTGGTEGIRDSVNTLKNAGYHDVSSRQWPHMRHETMNEKNYMEVFKAILEWLDEHAVSEKTA
ncbi:MAG: alpha/beta hydrolase [Erysipelotrichia bacterium]|nr:alpha/beta hydrolase [Erysipelotrichia bacterium]